MEQITTNANEIQQLVSKIFGNNEITAVITGGTVLLTAETKDEQEKDNHNIALDNLFGMFKNTNLLSSDDFAKNKKYEKELEEEKFKYE